MTIRELYDYALIEMNKVEAPSLLLEDFNYFMNKAVQQYINKVYNRYDINQQSSDDLRVLKATTKLPVEILNLNVGELEEADEEDTKIGYAAKNKKFVYVANLPENYMHLLNCIVEFKVKAPFKCYSKGDHVDFPARRLTADMASGILHNAYMKPDYKRPYFYINNISDFEVGDQSTEIKNEADIDLNEYGSDYSSVTDSVKPERTRKANVSKVRLEIRYGDDSSVFEPVAVYVDYIKAPMFIRLTYQEVTDTLDKTRPLEFPDYVCYEIVNEFVKLLMENASDPRLQTNYAINQTVADPTAVPASQSSRDKS